MTLNWKSFSWLSSWIALSKSSLLSKKWPLLSSKMDSTSFSITWLTVQNDYKYFQASITSKSKTVSLKKKKQCEDNFQSRPSKIMKAIKYSICNIWWSMVLLGKEKHVCTASLCHSFLYQNQILVVRLSYISGIDLITLKSLCLRIVFLFLPNGEGKSTSR